MTIHFTGDLEWSLIGPSGEVCVGVIQDLLFPVHSTASIIEVISIVTQKGSFMKSIRFIPTGVHAYFDYIGGIALLAAPFIFGFFNVGGAAVIIPMVLGVGLILYSLLTNYELGIPGVKFIPMAYHLVIDFVAAAFLALSPFLFGFINKSPNAWLPHIIAGVAVILLVLVSQTRYQPRAGALA